MKASDVLVTASGYEFAHGHAPRGFGCWAFNIRGSTWWANSMNYGEAKKAAQRQAAARGASLVAVLS